MILSYRKLARTMAIALAIGASVLAGCMGAKHTTTQSTRSDSVSPQGLALSNFKIDPDMPRKSNDEIDIAWGNYPGATKYEFALSLDDSCAEIFFSVFTVETKHTITLNTEALGMKLYVCVLAVMSNGNKIPAKNSGLPLIVAAKENRPPVADAGVDLNMVESTAGQLDGSASTDPDEDAQLTYLWESVSGPALILSDNNSEKPTFAAPPLPAPAISVYKLTVSDGKHSDSDEVNIIIDATNDAPSISLTHPIDNDDFITISSTLNITWVAADTDHAAAIALYLVESNAGTCTDGQLLSSTLVEGPDTSYSFDTTGILDGKYYVCGVIDDGMAQSTSYSDKFILYPSDICTWYGGTDSTWSSAANWLSCSGATPLTTDFILLHSDAQNILVFDASRTIAGFGAGRGGGEINLNGYDLTTTDENNTFASSVTLEAPNDCVSCELKGNKYTVVNDATLTIRNDITVDVGYSSWLRVGSSTTTGHLIVDPETSDESKWPAFSGYYNSYISVTGVSNTEKSSITINGAHFTGLSWSNTNKSQFKIYKFADIKQMDNASFTAGQGIYTGNSVKFFDCEGLTISDKTWEGLNIRHLSYNNSGFVNAAACTDGITVPVVLKGKGQGFYSGNLVDPYGLFSIDENSTTSFICTFTGNISSDWETPGNWDNCNDRKGYPDAYDDVIIPSGKTVEVFNEAVVNEFSSTGAGGGTIQLSTGSHFTLAGANINSSVKFTTDTPSTAYHALWLKGTTRVLNDATLTLGEGIAIYVRPYNYLYIGDGTSNGHFVTEYTTGYKPRFNKYGEHAHDWGNIIVDGTSSADSSVDIAGIQLYAVNETSFAFEFRDYAEVKNMNNFVMSDFGGYGSDPAAAGGEIKFVDCTNITFSSTNWQNLSFTTDHSSGAKNIDVSGTNCNSIPTITLTGSGAGYGAAFHNDPGGVLDWQ